MRIVSFVGRSGTGKTTLIERLIPEFSARGLRVAVIKHDAHRFDIDIEGKDTWRFTKAGAVVSTIVSAEKSAMVETRKLSLWDMIARIKDVDIILVEGFSGEELPKIGLYRAASGNDLPPLPYAAVASDVPLEGYPVQFSLEDIREIAQYILDDPTFLLN
ncbi:Molybdopterin-guanine dinucleotide biosynthesis adapter protein [bioreactor metagenome]|uniref:Molybdopterin-guanine dinucleotide biosynthesis adapter protein n=1 Tax=bioreactor metagenome TaxID=1076179 RepID=A0A645ABZ6_9ZZZZ